MPLTALEHLQLPPVELLPLSRAAANGDRIALRDWGAPAPDAPTIVLAHANGFCGAMFCKTAVALTSRFHVLAYDARGHGASELEVNEATLNWGVMHDDLADLLDTLAAAGRIRLPVTAVGHSMGGAAVLCVAGKRPDLISQLMVLDPVVWWPEMLAPDFVSERKTQLVEGSKSHYVLNLHYPLSSTSQRWCLTLS